MKLVMSQRIVIGCLLLFLANGFKIEAQGHNKWLADNKDTEYVNILLKRATSIRNVSPDSALTLAKKALVISTNITDTVSIAKSLLSIGSYLFDKQQYIQSKQIFYQAIPYCLAVQKRILRV